MVTSFVKQHSEADTAENHLNVLYSDSNHGVVYREKWLHSPIFHKLRKHTVATDETSEIAELATGILDYSNPMYIGREVVSIHATTHESIKIRKPTRGKAVNTASNVTSIQAMGGSTDFLEIDLDQEIIANAEWNRTQIEDASSYLVSTQTQSITDSLMYLESKIILDKLYALRSEEHAGRITKGSSTNQVETPSMDLLIDLWGKVKEKDRMPNAYIMSPATCTTLLKDDDLKNSYYFQGHNVNYGMGHIGDFLGSKILVSSLVPDDFIACLDTSITLVYALRRDSMPIPYHLDKDDIHGLRISTRYGMKEGLLDGMAVWF